MKSFIALNVLCEITLKTTHNIFFQKTGSGVEGCVDYRFVEMEERIVRRRRFTKLYLRQGCTCNKNTLIISHRGAAGSHNQGGVGGWLFNGLKHWTCGVGQHDHPQCRGRT